MLFYVQRDVLMPNGTTQPVKILIGAKITGSTTILEATELMKDASQLELISSECVPKIAAFSKDSLLYVTADEIYDNSVAVDVVVKAVEQVLNSAEGATLKPAQSSMLINKLVNMTQGAIDEQTATCIVWYALKFVEYEKNKALTGPINVGPSYYDPRFIAQTQMIVNEINSALAWPYSELAPQDNETNLQNTCTDKLFIELPSRNQFMQEDFKMSNVLPTITSLCDPYKGLQLEDITEYKNDIHVPQSMYPMFEGVTKNNTFKLYDNEQLYYKSLIEWVQFNMKNSALGDVDLSVTNPNIDKLSQSYLEELAKLLYTRHWYHNINIPIYNPLESSDDDMMDLVSDSSGDSVTSDYKFRATASEKDAIRAGIKEFTMSSSTRVNALEQLVEFLTEASLSAGYIAYIQAIIQLARWGERKPTCIIIEGYSLVFSLGDNKIKPYMGDISDYTLVEVDGCPVNATAALYNDITIKCKQFMQDNNYSGNTITAPVGLTVTKRLQNSTNQGPREMVTVLNYSIIDIVKSYVDGNPIKIAGINYENDKFIASDAILMDDSNTFFSMQQSIKEEDNLEMPFKVSQDLEDLLLELDIQSGKILTHFDILNTCARYEDIDSLAEAMKFSNKEDFIAKRNSKAIRQPLMAFIIRYGIKLLEVYFKVSLKLNELKEERAVNFGDVLNIYKDVLTRVEIDVFDKTTTVSTSDMQNMDMFGATAKNTNAEPQASTNVTAPMTTQVTTPTNVTVTAPVNTSVPESRFTFIKEASSDATYVRLIDNAGSCVGCYAKEAYTLNTKAGARTIERMILHTPAQMSSIPVERIQAELPIAAITYRFLFNLHSYESNATNKIVLFFSDLECMAYYTKLFKQLYLEKRL